MLADRVALLEDGTITHVGDAPRAAGHRAGYRELLGRDDDLDELEEVDSA